jgi:hypothetical protein
MDFYLSFSNLTHLTNYLCDAVADLHLTLGGLRDSIQKILFYFLLVKWEHRFPRPGSNRTRKTGPSDFIRV